MSKYPCRAEIKHTKQMAIFVYSVMCVQVVNNDRRLLKCAYGLQCLKSLDCWVESVSAVDIIQFPFRKSLSFLSPAV